MSPRFQNIPRASGRLLALLAVLAVPGPTDAAAQTATLSGRVVDKGSQAAVVGATIILVAPERGVSTDSAGRYAFANIPAGTVRLTIRATAYPMTQVILDLRAGEAVDRTIELEPASPGIVPQALPAVAVSAAAPAESYRLVDFERRRRTGRGHYLSDEELRKSGVANLQDATRGMRGVQVHCGGGGGCHIQMTRARANCPPEYVIDGRVDNYFGPTIPIRDVVGLEVYTGPSDVPGEFAGTNAGCGVIVIWTRSGPPRRTP